MKINILISITVFIITFTFLALNVNSNSLLIQASPSLETLNIAILKAQLYYSGLYVDGGEYAVVKEYYTTNKNIYTVRHGTIGGIFYYDYIGDKTKSDKLKKLAEEYGFTPEWDQHSFIWNKNLSVPENIVYSTKSYRDCDTSLPVIAGTLPYHSKVCKLGTVGIYMYMAVAKFDTLLSMCDSLAKNKVADTKLYEEKYNQLGFGMPMCNPFGCSSTASTVRTAQFGELELRKKNWQYADSVASFLIKAQDTNGAVYASYDVSGKLKEDKPFVYSMLNKFLNDKNSSEYIPTNAETMNNVLAYLLHYRCEKYQTGCSI